MRFSSTFVKSNISKGPLARLSEGTKMLFEKEKGGGEKKNEKPFKRP